MVTTHFGGGGSPAGGGLAGLLLLGLGLFFGRELEGFILKCSPRNKFRDERWITTRQLANWLADRQRPAPVLLDVRTPAEWKVSHLPEARRVAAAGVWRAEQCAVLAAAVPVPARRPIRG